MPNFVTPANGDDALAEHVAQLTENLSGLRNIPIQLTGINDASNYALTIKNVGTGSKDTIMYAADGTTVLFQVDASGVKASVSGGPAAPILTTGSTLGMGQFADASITNAKLASDTARANLLTNPGFEVWSRGVGPFTGHNTTSSDRWASSLLGGDTLSVSRNTANVDISSQVCAACTFTLSTGGGSSGIQQPLAIADGLDITERTLAFSMRVRTSTASAVRLALYDPTNLVNTYSAFHTGSGAYETLSASYFVPANCIRMVATVYFAASCTAYLDNATLVDGSVAATYVPLHPADDLARCERYFERRDFVQSYPLGQVQGSGTTNVQGALLAFATTKALTPTITTVGTFSIQVGNGGLTTVTLAPNATTKHVVLGGTSTTTNGTIYTLQGSAATNAVLAESNP